MKGFEKNFMMIISLILLGSLHYTNSARLLCYYGYPFSYNNYYEIPLDNVQLILDLPCYNSTKDTVMFAYGFGGQAHGQIVALINGVSINTRKANSILVDWEEEASVGSVPAISYVNASANAKSIGKILGKSLNFTGLVNRLHLVGHSLGVTLLANTARQVQANGLIVSRFTCLDAAGPLYEGPFFKEQGAMPTDAKFVLAIHTNPGRLGTFENQGTVDVWPNCGSIIQPGCENSNVSTPVGTPQDRCSHDRAPQYFSEAVMNNDFVARSAASCLSWSLGLGTNSTITLGNTTDTQGRGNYYLRTNSVYPYGLGQSGTHPNY